MKLRELIDKLSSIEKVVGPQAFVYFPYKNTFSGEMEYYEVQPRVSDPTEEGKKDKERMVYL